MRVPQRVLQRAQAMAHAVDAGGQLGFALAVRAAQCRQLIVLGQVLGGGGHARAGFHDAIVRDSRGGELLQRGGGDVDTGAAETCGGGRAGEPRVEFGGDRLADLIAVAADARSERGHHALDAGALAGHHPYGFADHALLQAAAAAMGHADHAGFGVGQQHRQAVGGEDAEGDAAPGRDLGVGLDHRRLRLAAVGQCAAGGVEPVVAVRCIRFIHVDGGAGVDLADQGQPRVDLVGERGAVGGHMLRIVAVLAAEVEPGRVALAHAAQARGVHHPDAGGQHDGDGHRDRAAVLVGGADGVAVQDAVGGVDCAHRCAP